MDCVSFMCCRHCHKVAGKTTRIFQRACIQRVWDNGAATVVPHPTWQGDHAVDGQSMSNDPAVTVEDRSHARTIGIYSSAAMV